MITSLDVQSGYVICLNLNDNKLISHDGRRYKNQYLLMLILVSFDYESNEHFKKQELYALKTW